jgi:hypothetical protein
MLEHRAMPDLVCQGFLKKRDDIRVQAPRDPRLGPVNADSSIFASVIDLQDPGDRYPVSPVHPHFSWK